MAKDTNASTSIDGYTFQQVAALYLFLDKINEIKMVTVEGTEDIDIQMLNGDIKYLQAKKFEDPFDTSSVTKKLKETLVVLAKDNIENTAAKELIYVTNSNYPFLKTNKSNKNDFNVNYKYETYKGLSNTIKKYVIEQLHELITSNLEKNIELSNKLKQLENDLENKFSIIKIRYEGKDLASKTTDLRKKVAEFVDNVGLPDKLTQIFFDRWLLMMMDSASNRKIKIDRERFKGETVIITILKENDIIKFVEEFDLTPSSKQIIEDGYVDIFDQIISNYETLSTVNSEFQKYRNKNMLKKNSELLTGFIELESAKIIDSIWGTMSVDEEIAKYVIWSIIKNSAYMDRIERAMN